MDIEYFDTHCHLNNKRFNDDLAATVNRAQQVGVKNMVVVGTDLETSRRCVEIAKQNAAVHAAVGIQPNCAHEASESDWSEIKGLLNESVVVGLGETGLDRYWDDCPLEVQADYFDRHLRLSQDRKLPFVVHMRESGPDVLRMLTEARLRGPLEGVMHSFTGDMKLMQACVELGMYISFAGMVTFKKSESLREVASAVPDQRLLIETDAPYLSPEPMRKQRRNEPSLVIHTAACLAEVRGVTIQDLAELTTQNAKRFFGIAV